MFDEPELGRLRERVRRYLGRYLGRAEDAEDVTQESFVRVLEAAAKGEIRYPQSYLYRTARNLAFSTRARKFNQVECSLEDSGASEVIDDMEPGPEARVIAQRDFEGFCRAAAALPPQCRQVLVLRKVYGLSQREVAVHLDISVSTVEKHLAKALVRCGGYLDALHPDETSVLAKAGSTLKTPR